MWRLRAKPMDLGETMTKCEEAEMCVRVDVR